MKRALRLASSLARALLAAMVMNALFANYTAVAQRLGLAWEDGRIHGVVGTRAN